MLSFPQEPFVLFPQKKALLILKYDQNGFKDDGGDQCIPPAELSITHKFCTQNDP